MYNKADEYSSLYLILQQTGIIQIEILKETMLFEVYKNINEYFIQSGTDLIYEKMNNLSHHHH